jgi:hypothetical protein
MTLSKTKTPKAQTLIAVIASILGSAWVTLALVDYYAKYNSTERVLYQDERGVIITQSTVKVMHGPDMVPYAIWHKNYLYTPDTAMYQLVMFGK